MARKRGLDHDDVINAGFTVIDRDGVERVSLRAVADLLDVQPPSLYSHVAGLGGLLDDLAIAATADFGETLRASAIGIAGDDAVRAFATAYRGWARTHPGRYDLTLRTVAGSERKSAGIGAVETMDAILAHYGLTDHDARRAGRAAGSAGARCAAPSKAPPSGGRRSCARRRAAGARPAAGRARRAPRRRAR